MIQLENVSFTYHDREQTDKYTLRELNLHIKQGECISIIGPNGSGKSTLIKMLNGLLLPTKGTVKIDSYETHRYEDVIKIRQRVGMIFQNPENQFVGTTVLDDVAFGLENIGFPPDQMLGRIREALDRVEMWAHRKKQPSHLSGGQKQRVAIASVLAMRPNVIIFDEATSMLDPIGKEQIREMMKELHQEGMTIINVTHDMDEALQSNRLLVIANGGIDQDENPSLCLQKEETLETVFPTKPKMAQPFIFQTIKALRQQGVHLPLPDNMNTEQEMVEELWTLLSKT